MTHLLRAINEFPIRRVTRLALPNGTALKDACAGFKNTASLPRDLDERITRILTSFKKRESATLDRRDVRLIAAAIGSSALIGRNELSGILAEIERRKDNRLIRSVFRSLLASYRQESFRLQMRTFLARYATVLPSSTRHFSEQSGILQADEHLQVLGKKLARSKDIYGFCVSSGITSNILASNYGTELKLAVIREAVKIEDAISIQQCLDWAFAGISGTPFGDYYEAMLSPFEAAPPSPDVQKVLMGVLVLKFGDPRIRVWPGPGGKDGEVRRDVCVATIRRWLSIEYLDLFIKIIEATAEDRQFRPRKKFWLKYFEKGVISDLTLILATDADNIARTMRGKKGNAEYMQWANLNLALPNQSVLLMRLGDLIIAEWSHSGAMRFWKAEDKAAPVFHLSEYNSPRLRNGSIKIKVGVGTRESLVHQPNGQWMMWARNAIEYHTGVSV